MVLLTCRTCLSSESRMVEPLPEVDLLEKVTVLWPPASAKSFGSECRICDTPANTGKRKGRLPALGTYRST